MMKSKQLLYLYSIALILLISCENVPIDETPPRDFSTNILNYVGTPKHAFDKKMLMFSDKGAWFAYSLADSTKDYAGFSGPFLMTQQNGVWASSCLSSLLLFDQDSNLIVWDKSESNSYNGHLEQKFNNTNLSVSQELQFSSGNTALIKTTVTNLSDNPIELSSQWRSQKILSDGMTISSNQNEVLINSTLTNAVGHLLFQNGTEISSNDSSYVTTLEKLSLLANESKDIIISESFIFPEYSWSKEKQAIQNIDFDASLKSDQLEKGNQLSSLVGNRKSQFQDDKYAEVLAKSHLTLQNNWRLAAGEIKHEGLFPSYHYKWFNGFWSWDSWKHAVGLSYYSPELAKNQMRTMFDFQSENGFIVDCVFRDTTIESHNYRDTKPPLAAWAVAKIYKKDKDLDFIKEFYPKLKKYHSWWYTDRDHDQDSLCEYGSTDGSLIAAKWESGMDNAIRFDASKILKNGDAAFSIDQESVDLNAYLYAEKLYLAKLAEALQMQSDADEYKLQAASLMDKIQEQFYDANDGWFYDTNLEGDQFIKGEGSEGWAALWANAASQQQAEAVKNKMMNPEKFFTKIPFQTMSADHAKFDPLKGYWRGPNWLDQAYFGVKGLRNYGYDDEADKATIQIIEGAEGLLGKGTSIRENYHPITGEGLNAQNFSWSAAHVIMLLVNDN